MRGTIRRCGFLLVAIALDATLWSSAMPAAATSSRAPTTLAPGTIVAGRFVKAFALDGGAFRVVPAPADMGTRDVPRAIVTEAWATSQAQGYSIKGIAFGLVTVVERFRGVRVVHSQPAWVGLVQFSDAIYQCTAFNGPQKTAPSSSGWAVVVLGSGKNPPDVVYRANDVRCGHYVHSSLVNASETVSLPWRDDNGGALVQMPACSTVNMAASGGSRTGPPDLAIWVTRVDDPAAPGCTPSHPRVIAGSESAVAGDPSTTHDPIGPVPMVNPGAR